MDEKKFDPKKLAKLNNPDRLNDIPPETVWERVNPAKAGVMVEIGAGTAFFAKEFLRLSGASRLYACDLSEVMVEWMAENMVPLFPGLVPVKTSESSVPLEDGIADVVFMINLHHELEDPARIIAESCRILKPGGKIFIIDWKKEDMADGPPTRIRYESGQVKSQLESSGFKNIDVYGGLPKHFMLTADKGEKCA